MFEIACTESEIWNLSDIIRHIDLFVVLASIRVLISMNSFTCSVVFWGASLLIGAWISPVSRNRLRVVLTLCFPTCNLWSIESWVKPSASSSNQSFHHFSRKKIWFIGLLTQSITSYCFELINVVKINSKIEIKRLLMKWGGIGV